MAMINIDPIPVGCIVYDVDYHYTAEVADNDSDTGVLLLKDKARQYLFPCPRDAVIRVDTAVHQCKHTYHDVQFTDCGQQSDRRPRVWHGIMLWAIGDNKMDLKVWLSRVAMIKPPQEYVKCVDKFFEEMDRLDRMTYRHYLD